MKMTRLRDPRHDYNRRGGDFEQIAYSHAAPFFDNPRGVLVHRVRALFSLEYKPGGSHWGKMPWHIVEYWCENSGRSDAVDSGLVYDPGVKLICKRCEVNAMVKGEPTSSELAGRHVCVGICQPVNLCCPDARN